MKPKGRSKRSQPIMVRWRYATGEVVEMEDVGVEVSAGEREEGMKEVRSQLRTTRRNLLQSQAEVRW